MKGHPSSGKEVKGHLSTGKEVKGHLRQTETKVQGHQVTEIEVVTPHHQNIGRNTEKRKNMKTVTDKNTETLKKIEIGGIDNRTKIVNIKKKTTKLPLMHVLVTDANKEKNVYLLVLRVTWQSGICQHTG